MERGKHSVVNRPELLGAFEARATCSEAVLDGAGIGELYSALSTYPKIPFTKGTPRQKGARGKVASGASEKPVKFLLTAAGIILRGVKNGSLNVGFVVACR